MIIAEDQLKALISASGMDLQLEKKDGLYALKYKKQLVTDGYLKKNTIYEILLTLALLREVKE